MTLLLNWQEIHFILLQLDDLQTTYGIYIVRISLPVV